MTTVLVVDDQEDIRVLVCLVLGHDSMRCVGAGSFDEALDVLTGEPRPDLVLLDVQMPEHDGWELLERIRSTDACADVPVVMTTVKAHPRDEARAWELGCDGYVTKPFDFDALLSVIDSALARSRREASPQSRSEP